MQKQIGLQLIFILITSQLLAGSVLRKGKDFALFFAVKDYDEWADLRNPILDAKTIAEELEKEYDFQTEIIENPNRNTIYDVLERYQKMNFANDGQLLIFFTGHGEFIDSKSEGYFIPKDGKIRDRYADSYVPLNRIKNIVNNINCNHVLLAIDACYSGTINENIALGKGKLGQRPGEKNTEGIQDFIRRTLQHKTRLYLTSGGKERTPDGKDYSPFTKQFLEGLRDYWQNDGIVTFEELLAKLIMAEPRPRFGEFGHHEPGGNFLFVSNSKSTSNVGLPTDPHGRSYNIIKLNGHTWLAENLAYDIGEGSWCYDNKLENCQKYGRLYTLEAANKACAALGNGWRLPTDGEWKRLAVSFGGYRYVKESTEKTNLLDDVGDPRKSFYALLNEGNSGFDALTGGWRFSNGNFRDLGQYGSYWSAKENGSENTWYYLFEQFNRVLSRYNPHDPGAFSCRCIQD